MDSELVEMIHLCHHENPAARRIVALERYLEYCKPLNRLSLFGVLRASQESPTMAKAGARKCQIAILRYFARSGCSLGQAIHCKVVSDYIVVGG